MKRVAFKMKLTGFEKTCKKRDDERVADLWPNRLIGDGLLSKEQRRTHTNVSSYETR